MRVDIEDVFNNINERRRWNSPDLKEIEFFKDGKKVEVNTEQVEEWKYTGLSNEVFITEYEWPDY